MRVFKKYDLKVSVDNRRFYGDEPAWAADAVTDKNYNNQLNFGLNWYNYVCDDKDARRFLEDWIKTNREDADSDLKVLDKLSDKRLHRTYAHLARMKLQGFPLRKEQEDLIWERIHSEYQKESDVKPVAEAVAEPVEKEGVQERIDAQVSNIVMQIEDTISELLRGNRKEGKVQDIAGLGKFSSIHFKRLARALEPFIAEFTELSSARAASEPDSKQEQLIEGYSWVSTRGLKAVLAFLEECQGHSNRQALEKKVQRTRKKKPVDKAKLVRKLKFLQQHKELGLNSIKPVECLNASEVWVYDTRKRKLGVYRAEFDHSIMIKGNSFIGIAEKSCVQKTLRKPEVQLAEFLKLNKSQMRKWFDGIKGTLHQMKARSNEHVVLLKAS